MELVNLFALIVSTIAVTSSVVEAVSCNHTVVNDVCLKDFHSAVPSEKYLIDDKERRILCKAMRHMLSCLESSGCHEIPSVLPVYEGFKNGLQFVCNETTLQNEFVASCSNSYGFENAEVFCTANANNQTAGSQPSGCEQKNDLVACLVRSVDKCCGPEAARYVSQSILSMMGPLLKTWQCQLEVRTGVAEIDKCGAYHQASESSPRSNAGLIAGIVIIVLVVIIGVVVAVVVLIIRRHRMAEWLRV